MYLTEKGDIKVKTEALKKVIFLILNGEKLPNLLMTVIRFLLPLQVNISLRLYQKIESKISSKAV